MKSATISDTARSSRGTDNTEREAARRMNEALRETISVLE